MRKYRKSNPIYRIRINEYQKDNRDLIREQTRDWRDEIKCPIVYFFIDDMDRFIYIGSTFYKTVRLCNHFTNGNILIWKKYNLARVEYIDVSSVVGNKQELEYLERLFIQKNNPIRNKKSPNPNNIDLVKLRELDDFFYFAKHEYYKYEYDFEKWERRKI